MNKKVVAIAIAALLALAYLTVYTFGPTFHGRVKGSIKPSSRRAAIEQSSVNSKPVTLRVYHNRDIRENFYTVSVPEAWQILPGSKPGAYSFSLPGAQATTEILDIPDNTTVELFVLSQEEPRMKRTLAGYQRLDYRKVTVAGNDAYQLAYSYTADGGASRAVRTYVTGQDGAVVITLTADADQMDRLAPALAGVLDSFHWEP